MIKFCANIIERFTKVQNNIYAVVAYVGVDILLLNAAFHLQIPLTGEATIQEWTVTSSALFTLPFKLFLHGLFIHLAPPWSS